MLASFGTKAFSQMNSSMVIKIAIVATVTVGGMDAVVEPIGIYSRRVTGETVAIRDIFTACHWGNSGNAYIAISDSADLFWGKSF